MKPKEGHVTGKGYTVKHAEPPVLPANPQGPADPPPCTDN
jgi:hypothetical protein